MPHSDNVYSLAFSQDERYLASASADGTARVWEVPSGREVMRIVHQGEVGNVAFSRDARFLATGSSDFTARVSEVPSGREIVRVQFKAPVYQVAISPDGNYLAAASGDNTSGLLWEIKTGRMVLTSELPASAVAFSQDGRYLAVATIQGLVKVLRLTSGETVALVEQPTTTPIVYPRRILAFSADNKYLAMGGADAEELPERHSTRVSYQAVLRRWVKPRWGCYQLGEVRTVAVEQWLRSLPLAPKTKTHIRNLMHLLYQNARRWEMIDRNPIELVRQSSRRLGIPRVLGAEEVQKLLAGLTEPYTTMVLVVVCLGLRVSELLGLQWGDFDWENLTVLVQRGVVQGHVGETKTEYSRKPVPLDPDLATCLLRHRERSFYTGASDWVFAADSGRPRWQETILRNQIRPAAEQAGIGRIGWHTFRHTYSTLLRAIGTDVKVQQELLRHADIQTTMNIYTQAVPDAKRDANSKVVQMVLSGPSCKQKGPPVAAPE